MIVNKNLPFASRLSFALQGLRISWGGESSFRTHVSVAAIIILVVVAIRPSPIWWALLALTVGIVISAELFNTAIERLADHVQPQYDEEIKVIKDVAAAAVLMAALIAIAVAVAFVVEVFLLKLT
jgi:undecaprenol kinase